MKQIEFCLYMAFILIIFLNPVFSLERMPIAVFNLNAVCVEEDTASAVSDVISSELVNTPYFSIIERSSIRDLLERDEKRISECVTLDCALEYAQYLPVKRVVIGEIHYVNAIIITVRYVDVRTGTALLSASRYCYNIDRITVAASQLAKDLSDKIIEKDNELVIPKTFEGYYKRAVVPGWGQLYAGEEKKGFIFMGGFALSAVLAVYTTMDFLSKRDAYMDLERGTPQSEFDKKNDAKKSAGYLAVGSIGLSLLVYAASWADILYFSRPNFEQYSAGSRVGPGGIFFSAYTDAVPLQGGKNFALSAGMIF